MPETTSVTRPSFACPKVESYTCTAFPPGSMAMWHGFLSPIGRPSRSSTQAADSLGSRPRWRAPVGDFSKSARKVRSRSVKPLFPKAPIGRVPRNSSEECVALLRQDPVAELASRIFRAMLWRRISARAQAIRGLHAAGSCTTDARRSQFGPITGLIRRQMPPHKIARNISCATLPGATIAPNRGTIRPAARAPAARCSACRAG